MLTVYCLPCAGGSATMYLRWRQYLPEWVNLIPVELAGRGERLGEPFLQTFRAQVDDIYLRVTQMSRSKAGQSSTDKPYVIFGHSMGAMLGYQLLQKIIIEESQLPKALIVSASPAPDCRDLSSFEQLDDTSLIKELKQHNGTPDAVFEYPELLDMALATLRADYRMCASDLYAGEMTLDIPIHAFAGEDDDINLEDIRSWQKYTSADFTLDIFSGGHFYLKQPESEVNMIKKLTQILNNHLNNDMLLNY